ncbi:hypothetical protein [Streptomyces sp. S465]|uniref:hypothetical protein n=1 Tax=Streptomyces sp. S465 TaxID=2979468 RepID=UPI0022A8D0BB|nr:hypothetical protein [Streptomyces sp. S465]WAP54868.1 hypothetical protein N6H00_07630 [Streptomyces sp. S465]
MPGASCNVSASNVGNALGAWLGGLAISTDLGYRAPLYVGSAVVALGLAVMVVAARTAPSRPAGPDQTAGADQTAGRTRTDRERRSSTSG